MIGVGKGVSLKASTGGVVEEKLNGRCKTALIQNLKISNVSLSFC